MNVKCVRYAEGSIVGSCVGLDEGLFVSPVFVGCVVAGCCDGVALGTDVGLW